MPTDAPGDLAEDRLPPYMARGGFIRDVVTLGHVLELQVDQLLCPDGLTMRQLWALSVIAETPTPSRAELARKLHVSPQTVGNMTRRLARAGLINRPPLDPGRVSAVRLTAEGQRRLTRSQMIVADIERDMAASLSEQLIEGLLAGVREMLRSLLTNQPTRANTGSSTDQPAG